MGGGCLTLKGKKTVEEQTKENDTWANHNNSEKSPSLMKLNQVK